LETNDPKKPKTFTQCPHCGRELSPWEQVLLNVDRALMCKSCWYRIVLDAYDPDGLTPDQQKKH